MISLRHAPTNAGFGRRQSAALQSLRCKAVVNVGNKAYLSFTSSVISTSLPITPSVGVTRIPKACRSMWPIAWYVRCAAPPHRGDVERDWLRDAVNRKRSGDDEAASGS